MLLIAGVHGVGKSYFCSMIKDTLHIETFTASELISNEKHTSFKSNKLIQGEGITDNQHYLLLAINKLKAESSRFILDGHFCLLNQNGDVERIPMETFTGLNPNGIIVLTEHTQIIADRRKLRDGIIVSIEAVESFQNEEVSYASEIAEKLGVKLLICNAEKEIPKAIEFIRCLEGS